jgi:hypothetical protein
MPLNTSSSNQHYQWYRDAQPPPTSPHNPRKVDRDLLGLDKEELGLISRNWTCETLASFIEHVDETTKRKVHGETYEKTRSLLHTFSDFASQLGGITTSMAPNSEYTAALGAIAVLMSVSQNGLMKSFARGFQSCSS